MSLKRKRTNKRARHVVPLHATVLFGAAAEEPEDYARGDPVIVGLGAGAEGGAVVVDVEQADIPVARWVDVDAAADFIGKGAAGGRCGSADSGAFTGAADQAFDERSEAPAVAGAVEEARAEMVSVENIFGGADGFEAVAGVGDDLEPGFGIPAERAECAVEIAAVAGAAHAGKGVPAVEFDERSGATA